MTYTRNDLLELVDAFEELVSFHVANKVGHVVLEDYNLDDHNLDSQLKWIEDHRTEWLSDPEEDITEEDIRMVIGFLEFLKTIPEEQREAHWNDDD